jgi:hypothetical protein
MGRIHKMLEDKLKEIAVAIVLFAIVVTLLNMTLTALLK